MEEDAIYTIEDLGKALETFNAAYTGQHKANDTKQDFYCGITNDLEKRKSTHKVEKYAATIECDSFETSTAIEEALHDDGFDTGDQRGNGDDDSVFVYMYRQIPGVTQK